MRYAGIANGTVYMVRFKTHTPVRFVGTVRLTLQGTGPTGWYGTQQPPLRIPGYATVSM